MQGDRKALRLYTLIYQKAVNLYELEYNKYTDELYKQSEKIVANRLIPVLLNGGMSVSAFSRLKRNMLEIKCSMAESKEKEDFIITAYGLMNLFTSALFSMKEMEDCIQTGILKHPVRSPKERIDYLWEMVDRLESLAEIGLEVIGCLEKAYQSLYEESPKALWLKGYVSSHCDEKTVVVVPKAYYIDIWNPVVQRSRIYDDRFAKALGVSYFGLPTNISYERFPEWYFCPKCRRFQPLNKWVREYLGSFKNKEDCYDQYMVKHMQCTKCRQDLVVARIVTVCSQGHLNDFPWIKWVHAKSKPRKRICAHPELQFKTGASSTEGLEGLSISCSCGAFATLSGAFQNDCFEKLDEASNNDYNFICEGNHPFRHVKERCSCHPRTVQRGASSVYFPLVYSSLVIPPYTSNLISKIENSNTFSDCITIIEDEDPQDREFIIKRKLSKWSEKIAAEIFADKVDVERILTRKWLEQTNKDTDVSNVRYRLEEYSALSGEVNVNEESNWGDFSQEEMDISEYNIPHIQSIALIDRVRVVNALTGFSRIQPATNPSDRGFVCVKEPATDWYPAYQVRGEGIFIEIKDEDILRWEEEKPQVKERAAIVNRHYNESFIGVNNPRTITPRFILLHTLSHLLISQQTAACGRAAACAALFLKLPVIKNSKMPAKR